MAWPDADHDTGDPTTACIVEAAILSLGKLEYENPAFRAAKIEDAAKQHGTDFTERLKSLKCFGIAMTITEQWDRLSEQITELLSEIADFRYRMLLGVEEYKLKSPKTFDEFEEEFMITEQMAHSSGVTKEAGKVCCAFTPTVIVRRRLYWEQVEIVALIVISKAWVRIC